MRRYLFILLCFTIIACNNAGHAPATSTIDSAVVTTATVTTTATSSSPDCPLTAEAATRIAKALSLQELEQMSDKEARNWKPAAGECFGLCDQMFDTEYDSHCIIGIHRFAEYMGAHPSSGNWWFYFSKTTGKQIMFNDMFVTDKRKAVTDIIARQVAHILKQGRRDVDPEDYDTYDYGAENGAGHIAHCLNLFSITDTAIVFHIQFEFPHVVQALEPSGNVAIPIAELKPCINPSGPLAFMLTE